MAKLSPGVEWLIQNQAIHRKAKTITVIDLIPAPDEAPVPSSQGDRVITIGGDRIEVEVLPLKRRQ